MGESGTGKFSLLTEIYPQVNPGGRTLLIDAIEISPNFHDDAVPPLRHRTEDMATIVSQVLTRISHGRPTRAGPAAMRLICRYSWPRNITQLEEALAAALLRRPVGDIQPEDLPGYCHDSARRQLTGMEAVERDAIVNALRDSNGNRVSAAATLGIARSSLYSKLTSFGISTI
jgi:transcriptional regulator of acetoin/glycerol metabolism